MLKNSLTIYLLLWFSLSQTAGCGRSDSKDEKRLLSEINAIVENSRRRLNSAETRASLIRLNEIRPSFPENRDEIAREAEAVRQLFLNLIEEDKKISTRFKELRNLPLSESYRTCVDLHIQSTTAGITRLETVIEEVEALQDPTIPDLASLQARIGPIRAKRDAADSHMSQIDKAIDSKCRRPGLSSSPG